MSEFITDLISSIFVAGPTDSLLLATNISFASLQLILFLLLIATFSYHFAILSVLCGGLWYSINWFVRELKEVQRQEAEKRRATEGEKEERVKDEVKVIPETKESGSHEVEPVEVVGEVKRVRTRASANGKGTEHSTEDEWEKVDENEKDV